MKRAKCPKCGSTSLYVPCTVMAKVRYNSEHGYVYDVNKGDECDYFSDSVTCNKCGWKGSEDELK